MSVKEIELVRPTKLAEMTGYTVDAIRGKRTQGVWLEGIHWFKAPDGRLAFDYTAIQRWMRGLSHEC